MTGKRARHRDDDGGFTYLEVLVAIAVLAIATTAMASALEQVRMAAADEERAAVAEHLLHDGLAWVRTLPRLDATSPVFGAESGETRGVDIDDVDDLANVVETAPVDRGGTMHGAAWSRRWTIESVRLANPDSAGADGSTTLLRIGLTVAHDGDEVATASLLLARTP
jgi:prepilin-type N-terminal cleavage/methylation domain-containing protein